MLATTAGTAAVIAGTRGFAALAGDAAPDDAPSDVLDLDRHPWIDAHSHVWSRDIEKYPLANGNTLDSLSPPSFTDEELLAVAHRSGVGRVVLIHHHPYHGWDNSYLIDVAARRPGTFRIVGTVDNFAGNPGAKMRAMLDQHVTGFRVTPGIHNEKWLAGGMDEMWETAADTGQNIALLINPPQFPEIDAMCKKHPATPVVIDHFARIGVDGDIRDDELDALCALARHEHVAVKASAYYALGMKKAPYLDLAPMFRRVLDAYGPERVMWATDCPYQLSGDNTYDDSIALVRDRLDFLSDGDRESLLHKTAQRVYFFV
jgi:predicted TIM-barrel fold metal-dependent hydrolase